MEAKDAFTVLSDAKTRAEYDRRQQVDVGPLPRILDHSFIAFKQHSLPECTLCAGWVRLGWHRRLRQTDVAANDDLDEAKAARGGVLWFQRLLPRR